MAYDELLANRIRGLLAALPGYSEKKMFGGIGFLLHGHMAAGAHNDGNLLINCARDDTDALLAETGTRPMERGGKPMRGWVLVDASAVAEDDALAYWVGVGRDHALSKPPK